MYAANKDGGAHVDTNLPEDYVRLIEGMGWTFSRKRPGTPNIVTNLRYSQFAPLRQMAYEVLHSPSLTQLAD
jgi:hypothetical protein